ncbi:hypothetical protein ebA2204 [Aromatoleum aromaticum EbN1]|uniref:Uncharacterized protein n=1 Tax=Aromatoleum aromaticum (strain DSM 19018 / LMG 30748 / EbN1) TaxID=76114 RepID=Q5P5S0_AROAE|nr:hypothetical protein ebA2204 [Aromatoleum aromaticum EbN1]
MTAARARNAEQFPMGGGSEETSASPGPCIATSSTGDVPVAPVHGENHGTEEPAWSEPERAATAGHPEAAARSGPRRSGRSGRPKATGAKPGYAEAARSGPRRSGRSKAAGAKPGYAEAARSGSRRSGWPKAGRAKPGHPQAARSGTGWF